MSILFVADAMRVGSMYEPDLPGAEAWYKVAEKSGSVRGTFGLGLTYLRMGRIAEARRKLEEAISKNYPPAFNALAGIYFRGDGAAQDLQRARDLWRKGASLGHLPARRNLLAQQLRGRYGVLDFIAGVISFVPTIASIVSTRLKNPYTDLLR
ncbi:MAG TPA: hypothetical protein VEC04_03230 [Brevundimonas sp.]|nr:hypothetical protein [Brevundimonas sp.]